MTEFEIERPKYLDGKDWNDFLENRWPHKKEDLLRYVKSMEDF